ncbi:MAG: hypothetical protein WKF73_06980 [Nocardioidaceae bacterium]
MATEDVRSVGELLLDADWITRDILMDVAGEHAPAMLRTWGEAVEAAAQFVVNHPAAPGCRRPARDAG